MKFTRIILALWWFGAAASLHPSTRPEPSLTDGSGGGHAAQAWTPAAVGGGLPSSGPPTLVFAGLAMLGVFFLSHSLYLLAQKWRQRAVMEERAHLAHEIHDTLAQSFAGIGFQLQAIRNSMPPNSQALAKQVDLAMDLTRSSHEEVRRCVASLRPQALGRLGLLSALRACAEGMVNDGGVKVETFGGDGVIAIPPRIQDTLFRIGREAIANSIRHAGPNTIRIRLHHHPTSIYLSVEDDGTGFVADCDCTGFGLAGMRNRAESISADLVVRSAPSSGTRVEVRAPLKWRFDIVARPKLLFRI